MEITVFVLKVIGELNNSYKVLRTVYGTKQAHNKCLLSKSFN